MRLLRVSQAMFVTNNQGKVPLQDTVTGKSDKGLSQAGQKKNCNRQGVTGKSDKVLFYVGQQGDVTGQEQLLVSQTKYYFI